jgi:predicted Zn-dependent protease
MRKIFIIVLCCVAVLLAGYAGYRGYQVSKRSHLISLARQFMAKSDARNALLSVQQVLRSDPQNLEATRMMAQLTEAARSPSALLWRSRVVELNPLSLDDRLALATTAMVMRDYATATNALDGVAPAERNTVAYHNVAGAVAAAVNQTAQAESHFLEAARLDPKNEFVQLNLAMVRLHGTNVPVLTEARAALKRIGSTATNSALRCLALRELATDALRQRRGEEALSLSKQLLQETNSSFRDRVLRLEVLQETRSSEFKPALAAFQHEAAGDPGKIYELAIWQMAKTSPAEALTWLQSLPMGTQTNQAVALLVAECYTMQRDWSGLRGKLEKQNWGELEFVRHAYLVRALRSLQLTDSSKAEWEFALKEANGQKATLTGLLRLTAQWNWMSESEELLWTIVNRYPEEKWATQALAQALYVGGRTRSLMQLYSQELARTPSDFSIKNNLAILALLLDAQELKPYELAKEAYQSSPTNAAYVSTYAFSLCLQNKPAEALKAMEQLKPRDLQDPSIAGYYGIILKATGNREKARVYLNWSAKGQALPEEKALFEKAKMGI